MQDYLPLIKSMLSEWYAFTLNNALYAAALATAVWLLTSMLYSIRIAALTRGKIAEQKAAEQNLNAMQQQLQQSQETLAETVEQMEKARFTAQNETQRTLTLEQLIYQRNQQIAGTIQTLATGFDLGERPLLATEDVKADALWQQHDKVVTQLAERLRTELQAKIELQQTCRAESAKLAEKEALLKALQSTLDNHTGQLAKLELALQEQKSILQHQDDAQQLICDTLKKYQPGALRPAEPEPETVAVSVAPVQLEEPAYREEILIVPPNQDSQAEAANEEAQAALSEPVEQTPVEPAIAVEAIAPVSLEITPQADEEAQPVSVDVEPEPLAPAKGSFGKIKNLFGKKQQAVKTEPQWTVADVEIQPLPLNEAAQPIVNTDNDEVAEQEKTKPGRLKGFYNKFASKGK